MLDPDTEWFSGKYLLKYPLDFFFFLPCQRVCVVWHLSSSAMQVAGTRDPKLLCELSSQHSQQCL